MNQELVFLYGTVSINIIVLLWIGYMTYKTKKMIKREIENADPDY